MTGDRVAVRRVVGEGEVLARADHHLEALVVDERPEALVAELVLCHVGVHQLHAEYLFHVESLGAVHGSVVSRGAHVEEPGALHVLVGAVGWSVSQRRP